MATIQVRNVSAETRQALQAKATSEGRSLNDFLLRELDRIATRPSRTELLERIAGRPVATLESAARGLRSSGRIDDAGC